MSEQASRELQRVRHKFWTHEISPQTETLIIGTFNPCTSTDDFFYGSPKNYLWTLLPQAFGAADLKGKSKIDKENFIKAKHIDFIDLILEVEVEVGQEWKRDDKYITRHEPQWRNVISELTKLNSIKRVCFTRKRKGLSAVHKIKGRIRNIEDYCKARKSAFDCIISPARYYSAQKQDEWNAFFNKQG